MGMTQANGADLYYEIYGEGEPLVLIQGCGGDVTFWEPQIELLSQYFRLILFDNRGMGRSEVTPGDYTTQLLANDAASLLDQLGIKNANVLGWSMGGMIAQELAINRSDLVKKLVIAASSSKFPDKSAFVFKTFLDMVQRGEFESLTRWHMSLCFSQAFFSHPPVVDQVQASFMSPKYPATLEGLASQVSALNAHDSRGRLGNINAPTIVLGAEEDGFFPVQSIYETAAGIKDAKALILPGAHLYYIERPMEFSQAVVQFLRNG